VAPAACGGEATRRGAEAPAYGKGADYIAFTDADWALADFARLNADTIAAALDLADAMDVYQRAEAVPVSMRSRLGTGPLDRLNATLAAYRAAPGAGEPPR
jgi:hypothetical protein